MSDPVVLRAETIHLRLGNLLILNGISLDVRQGRCLMIMGANGAGKSQFLRVLNGLSQKHRALENHRLTIAG